MQLRKTILALFMIASTAAMTLHADEPSGVSSDHATVKLFFINQYIPVTVAAEEKPASPIGGLGGMGAMQMQFETASIYLNDKFVGHTIFRHADVSPKFNLQRADYKFRIECDGYEKFETNLTVLDGGSLQWLVVKLEPQTSSAPGVTPATPKN